MKIYNQQINEAFHSNSVIKVITGINNTNANNVIKIAKAADLSKATYLDIAANPKLVRILKKSCQLPICISSINPVDIYNCISAGADLIEVGNYDFLYDQGIYLTLEQILDLVTEIKSFASNIDICVTIPYHISIPQQIYLAKQLEILGVNIIQTEGISQLHRLEFAHLNFDLINLHATFLPSLLSTYMISQAVNIPIISASGCKNILSYLPAIYGASGVGIGSSLYKQNSVTNIVKYINQAHFYIKFFISLKNKLNILDNNFLSLISK